MLEFYIIAGVVALAAAVAVVRPLVQRRDDVLGRDAADARVFRDQLTEIDRDLERGTISKAEAQQVRIEVSRRLLAAASRAEKSASLGPAPQGHSGLTAGLALVGIPALAAALYFGIGAPGFPDQPLSERRDAAGRVFDAGSAAQRPSQAEAEAMAAANLPPAPEAAKDMEFLEQIRRLEEVVANRPNDAEGHRLLADALLQVGRWSDASKTFGALIDLLGSTADADIHASHAEAMVLAAGGYVSPEAEIAIRRALERDPSLPMARYYAGLALRQEGQIDHAIQIWRGLRRDAPPGAPYVEWLDMMIAETVAARDGVAAPSGPSQAEIDAAQEMTDSEREEMIRGMVARLDDRLSARGGSAEEWGRLVASYATMGDEQAARHALDRALEAYPTGPEHEALVAHAVRLGIDGSAERVQPGPTAAEIEAAQQLSSDDRAAMIEGMVARLESRLTTDGGEAEEWLRLINAYVQLGRPEDAARVYRLAEVALDGDPSAGFVKEQALLLGVTVE